MSGRIFARAVLLAVFAAFATIPLSAREPETAAEPEAAEDGGFVELDAVVAEISFEGLKKTRESYLRPKLERFVGGTVAETDVHEVETALQAEGIFEEIDVSLERAGEGTARLSVAVKEKITFIPLPFAAYSSSNGFMAGLMVMDTNAFGVKDTVVFGGFGSASSATGFVLFSKPPRDDGSLGVSVSGSFSRGSPELKNLDEDTALEYGSIGGGAKFGLSRKFGAAQTVRAGIAVAGNSSDEDGAWPSPLVESCVTGTLSAGWGISFVDWNGWFLSTSSASVSAESTWRLHSDSDAPRWGRAATVSASLQKPVAFDRLRVFARATGTWGADQPLSMWWGGSNAGTTLLPGGFRTARIAAASAGLEVALVRFGFGLVSVYGDYQAAVADDFSAGGPLGAEFCHGPDFGARLYLSKIAFPALAFGFARNVPREYWQYSFSLGMAF